MVNISIILKRVNKSVFFLVAIVLFAMLHTQLAYSEDVKKAAIQNNKAYDLDIHLGAGIGFGRFTPDKKIGGITSATIVEHVDKNGKHHYTITPSNKSLSNGKETDYYAQLGVDVKLNQDYNVTPYVDFTLAQQYKNSPTSQIGIGTDVLYEICPESQFVVGGELHYATFNFGIKVKNKHSEIKDTLFVYKGIGATLSSGFILNKVSIKLFYTYNPYTLSKFDTHSKEANEAFKKILPQKTKTATLGLTLGVDF